MHLNALRFLLYVYYYLEVIQLFYPTVLFIKIPFQALITAWIQDCPEDDATTATSTTTAAPTGDAVSDGATTASPSIEQCAMTDESVRVQWRLI